MTSDSELLSRLARSGGRAFVEVYDTFSPGLYRYAYRLLGDAETAEECVARNLQPLFGALAARQAARATTPGPHLYRVAHSWITDFYHRSPPPARRTARNPACARPPARSGDDLARGAGAFAGQRSPNSPPTSAR